MKWRRRAAYAWAGAWWMGGVACSHEPGVVVAGTASTGASSSGTGGPATGSTTGDGSMTGTQGTTGVGTSDGSSGDPGTSTGGATTSSSSDDGPACMLPAATGSSSGDDGLPLDLGDGGGCGNGVVEVALGEVCDDGNAMGGDGCENDCTSSDDVEPEFTLFMGGPTGWADCGNGAAFDSAGNLVFAGSVNNSVWIRKYDPAYQELWTVTYPAPPGVLCFDVPVAIDSADNIAFAGVTGTLDNVDWLVGMLDPDGGELWSAVYDGPVGRNDYPKDVVVDGSDDLVVVGSRENPVNGTESAILKFTTDGLLLWSEFLSSGNGQADVNWSVAADACDNLLVSAAQYNDGTGADIVVRKYDADGGLEWERFEVGPLTDWGYGIGVDRLGRSVVAGAQPGASPYFDFWLRKYDADGTELWTQSWDGGADDHDYVRDVVVAQDGTTWAAGAITEPGGYPHAVVMRLDENGAVVWTRHVIEVGGWLELARAPDGRIAVAGASQLPFPYDAEAHFAVYPP
ncbi:MAG: hypothetical protein IPH07_04955 [Deltaproteobacteria bacterium]|nr:hypothetical protein [Deltaproteobacteria bacterium]MBK8719468.1 hypothetical protein [Deltaproteobacteria bacterium]